jgi:hypothetical protein
MGGGVSGTDVSSTQMTGGRARARARVSQSERKTKRGCVGVWVSG